jgi:hypothetical protein
MDVFLSEDAVLLLRAHALDGQEKDRGGLLLGHKRGQRFIVEQVYPSRERFFSSERTYWALDRLFRGKIIGFYSFASSQKKAPPVLRPFAYGKIFLRITLGPKHRWTLKPHVIEFKDSFFLLPIALRSPTKEKR